MILSKNKRILGFTLTEMMIVIAIIAILAVIAMMSFLAQQHKGNDSKRKADLDRIKIAVEEYEKDNNCYPPAALMMKCGNDADIAIHPYLSNVPCDPTTGEPYRYEVGSTTCPDWFRIFSLLQYTKDPSVILNIGPTDDPNYNYYVSSDNAPIPIGSSSTPTGLPAACGEADRRYGCISGTCVEVQLNASCQPVCDPAYDSMAICAGQCTSGNPASECVPL